MATFGMVHTGRCHCEGVQYRVTGPLRPVQNCHCEPCRRITGHHMAASATTDIDLHLDNDETLTWYCSVPGTFYGFCDRCGATLFWRVDDRPDRVSIAAGTLDPPTGLRTDRALFVAEHGDYHTREPMVTEWPGDQT